jgi:hypothetical protein
MVCPKFQYCFKAPVSGQDSEIDVLTVKQSDPAWGKMRASITGFMKLHMDMVAE